MTNAIPEQALHIPLGVPGSKRSDYDTLNAYIMSDPAQDENSPSDTDLEGTTAGTGSSSKTRHTRVDAQG